MCSVLCTSNQTSPSHQRVLYTFLSPDNAKVENNPFKPKSRRPSRSRAINQLIIASQTLKFLVAPGARCWGRHPIPTPGKLSWTSAGVCIGAHIGNVFFHLLGLRRGHVLGPVLSRFQVFRVQGAVLIVWVLRACVVAAPRECSDRLVFGRKYVVEVKVCRKAVTRSIGFFRWIGCVSLSPTIWPARLVLGEYY